MEDYKVTIRNYRSIAFDNPLTLEIKDGITFILGVNNIGKSNLLKLFYEFRSIHRLRSNLDDLQQVIAGASYEAVKNQNSEFLEISVRIQFPNNDFNIKISSTDGLSSSGYSGKLVSPNRDFQELPRALSALFKDSLYIGSFRTPMKESNGQYFDTLIGEGFTQIWNDWADGDNLQHRRAIKKLTGELRELFGFKEFIIRVGADKKRLLIETEQGSFYLDELGGGIGHFILVLGNVMIKKPSFIFIDEPENSLHPKMQEDFLRILASKAKYGVVATSHSIGLARSAADHIYLLSKDRDERLMLTKYGEGKPHSIRDSISELGYSQFVELGGNHILLVEGRTDIKCFREILRKYKMEQHFIIMDLGGANGINENAEEDLRDLLRLNAKSYSVIFDSERESDGVVLDERFVKFIEMCKRLNFNVFPTEVHSTENYLTDKAIKKVLGEGFSSLAKFENFSKRPKEFKWGKVNNWKAFREMTIEDFENTGLHEFIKTVLMPLVDDQ